MKKIMLATLLTLSSFAYGGTGSSPSDPITKQVNITIQSVPTVSVNTLEDQVYGDVAIGAGTFTPMTNGRIELLGVDTGTVIKLSTDKDVVLSDGAGNSITINPILNSTQVVSGSSVIYDYTKVSGQNYSDELNISSEVTLTGVETPGNYNGTFTILAEVF